MGGSRQRPGITVTGDTMIPQVNVTRQNSIRKTMSVRVYGDQNERLVIVSGIYDKFQNICLITVLEIRNV